MRARSKPSLISGQVKAIRLFDYPAVRGQGHLPCRPNRQYPLPQRPQRVAEGGRHSEVTVSARSITLPGRMPVPLPGVSESQLAAPRRAGPARYSASDNPRES